MTRIRRIYPPPGAAAPATLAKAPRYSVMAVRSLANIPSERFYSLIGAFEPSADAQPSPNARRLASSEAASASW